MQIDEFLELVKKRRSIRRFKPDPIPDEYVEKILEAGRWAMSGSNGQPWEFIVVKSQETKDKMARALKESNGERDAVEMTRVETVRHPAVLESPDKPFPFVEAPLVIVVCGDRRTFQATVLATHFLGGEGGHQACFYKNMANATQNMHLAAAALGLGSQWNSIGRLQEHALKAILDVPPVLEIHSLVVVGYPAQVPKRVYRRELKEIVHYEKYDRSKFRTGKDIVNWLAALRRRSAAETSR